MARNIKNPFSEVTPRGGYRNIKQKVRTTYLVLNLAIYQNPESPLSFPNLDAMFISHGMRMNLF